MVPTTPRFGLSALVRAAGMVRAARPWWIVPFLLVFGLSMFLALQDFAPMRALAYSVH